MVRPKSVDPEEKEDAQIVPLSSGQVGEHNFVLSVDRAGSVFVQFEDGAVGFNVGEMLAEAHAQVYGYVPDDEDIPGNEEEDE